jgi:hypothetical protein
MSVSTVVPDFFTLPEAGRILRIGRNSAYKAATEFERTGGVSGLPFVKVGKLKRVPRLALEKLLGGPITWPLGDDVSEGADAPDAWSHRSDLLEQRASISNLDRGLHEVELQPIDPPDQQPLPFEG